jgi:hypothetical protein
MAASTNERHVLSDWTSCAKDVDMMKMGILTL